MYETMNIKYILECFTIWFTVCDRVVQIMYWKNNGALLFVFDLFTFCIYSIGTDTLK